MIPKREKISMLYAPKTQVIAQFLPQIACSKFLVLPLEPLFSELLNSCSLFLNTVFEAVMPE